MRILNNHLSGFSVDDRNEILSDIDEHFSTGLSNGKTEDEISSSLGDPELLAKQYKNDTGNKNEDDHTIIKPSIYESFRSNINPNSNNAIMFIVMLFINIFIVFWLIIAAVATIFGLWISGIAISVAGIAVLITSNIPELQRFNTLAVDGLAFPSGLLSIGLVCLGILIIIGMFYLTKLFIKLIKIYINWNVSLLKGVDCK
jgi:uncharacterized membrane protein